VDWPGLPAACVLQIHWPRTRPFLLQLAEHRFHVVVLARHPLDVLISILHYAWHDNSTLRWLDGEGGDERPIWGAMPCSRPFLAYATGPRARALLSVTRAWWRARGCLRLRYEDLVARPHHEVTRLVEAVGGGPQTPVAEAVAASTIPELRRLTRNGHHFWQGTPDLWKSLLPAGPTRRIAHAQRASFAALGYACDPDPALDRGRAEANWVALNRLEWGAELQSLDKTMRELCVAEGRATELQRSLSATTAELAACRQACQEARVKLAAFGPLAPAMLQLARGMRRLSRRYPQTASLVKRLLRTGG
jgi:hypothetical protein